MDTTSYNHITGSTYPSAPPPPDSPTCLLCDTEARPPHLSTVHPCGCGPFHDTCLTSHERATANLISSGPYVLCCPGCYARVSLITHPSRPAHTPFNSHGRFYPSSSFPIASSPCTPTRTPSRTPPRSPPHIPPLSPHAPYLPPSAYLSLGAPAHQDPCAGYASTSALGRHRHRTSSTTTPSSSSASLRIPRLPSARTETPPPPEPRLRRRSSEQVTREQERVYVVMHYHHHIERRRAERNCDSVDGARTVLKRWWSLRN